MQFKLEQRQTDVLVEDGSEGDYPADLYTDDHNVELWIRSELFPSGKRLKITVEEDESA